MLVRLLQQKHVIRCGEDDLIMNIEYQLTPNDWMLILKVINLLKPFADATLDAEYEEAFISDTIPLIKKIYYELNAIHQWCIGSATGGNAVPPLFLGRGTRSPTFSFDEPTLPNFNEVFF